MDQVFVATGVGLLLLMFLVLYRTVVGPTSVDRLIGVNIIGTKTTILLLIIGLVFKELDMYVDLALAYALLNFIASVAAAALLRSKRTTDPWSLLGGGLR